MPTIHVYQPTLTEICGRHRKKQNKFRPPESSNEYLISIIHAHGHTSSACKLKDLSSEFPTTISWVVGDFKHSWSIDDKISGTVLE